jgi:hypothetical protein
MRAGGGWVGGWMVLLLLLLDGARGARDAAAGSRALSLSLVLHAVGSRQFRCILKPAMASQLAQGGRLALCLISAALGNPTNTVTQTLLGQSPLRPSIRGAPPGGELHWRRGKTSSRASGFTNHGVANSLWTRGSEGATSCFGRQRYLKKAGPIVNKLPHWDRMLPIAWRSGRR